MTDIKGQRQADQRWNRVGHHIAQQALQPLAPREEWAAARALHNQAPKYRQDRKGTDPHPRQQQEIARHAPRRACGCLVYQAPYFVRGAISTQAPGVDEVLVEVELVLHVVDAGTDGPEQPAFYQQFRLGRRFGSGRSCRGLQGAIAAEQQRAEQ